MFMKHAGAEVVSENKLICVSGVDGSHRASGERILEVSQQH